MSSRIAIVGAGPGGLTAAIAARRAGLEVDVFEQAPAFARAGGGVGIQSNGMRALDALGLYERIRPRIQLCHEAAVYSPPDRMLSRADFREVDIPHAGFGVMLRFELQEFLVAALRELGVEIRFGARCEGVRMGEGGPGLQISADGTRRYDAVIACDGVHSAIRDGLGVRVRRRVIGEAYLRAVAGRAIRHGAPIGEFWAADGRRLGAFPLADERAYLFCSVPLGRWPELRDRDRKAWIASWSDFGAPIVELLEAVDWGAAVYDELQEVRVEPWHRGAVFLIGDAAHAMTPNLGQGANSAMVDAVVLVRLLADALRAGGGLAHVGPRYEAIRRAFVTRIQDTALQGGRAASWTSPPARGLRDGALRLMNRIAPLRRASLRLVAGWNPAEEEFLRPARDAESAPGDSIGVART